MQIKLSDRATECQSRMKELQSEMNDYNAIVMCIRALQAVSNSPGKYTYSQEDYDKVVDKLRSLCEKHEILLPATDYMEWGSIEIL